LLWTSENKRERIRQSEKEREVHLVVDLKDRGREVQSVEGVVWASGIEPQFPAPVHTMANRAEKE
jgi:hypothetical protein